MKNPIFKAQVEALFEKKSFSQDPLAVAAAHPELRSGIHRGLGLEQGFSDVAAGGDKLLRGGGWLADKVLTGGSAVGGRILGGVSDAAMNNPRAAIAAAALLPTLGSSGQAQQRHEENALRRAYEEPMQTITASLEEFLEKKAAAAGTAPFSVGTALLTGLIGGASTGLVNLLGKTLGDSASRIKNTLFQEPRRKALLESLFKSDPVIKDALARHPDSQGMLLESYGTMTKFAPTLSMDINAVRSFLREAVLGGAGVNYATIKNLVDTEKAVSESKNSFGGKH